jgi:hypothetical protein
MRVISLFSAFLILFLGFSSCNSDKTPTASAPPVVQDNTLTADEQAAGWQLLFDGKTIQHWHNYGKTTIGQSWVVSDGAIHLDARPGKDGHWQAADGGDIISNESYQNFEFSVDWKIDTCGNSGIFFNVVEDTAKYDYGWKSGPEMQVLDNACHPDAKITKHRAGDLYDLISCKTETVKPGLQWNTAKIISKSGHLEQWLNGVKVVEVQMFTPEWEQLIAGSKFKEWPGFGKSDSGRIGLQDHGNKVWFKNIKIKKL